MIWSLGCGASVQLKVSVVAQASRLRLEFGHFGLASRGIATAPANRGAPKARIIPAQPSGLGNRTGDAKALKARSISIPGITLVDWVPCLGGNGGILLANSGEWLAGKMWNEPCAQ